MGITTSTSTILGGVLGCELGFAAGKLAVVDSVPADGIQGAEGEFIGAVTALGTLIGSIDGFAVGRMMDGANKKQNAT